MGTNPSINRLHLFRPVLLACIFCISLAPSLARAQYPPALSLVTPDYQRGVQDVPGTVVVRVRHFSGELVGGFAAKFKIVASSGFTGVLVGEEYVFGELREGNVTDGVLVYYPEWMCDYYVDFSIVELTYQLMGTSAPCSYITVVAHPDETTPLVLTCTLGWVAPRIEPFGVQWDWSTCEFPVPTRETTWGRVKALYRD